MPYLPPISYPMVRQTICDVVAAATGLDAQQILMVQPEDPGAPLPPYPFVTFHMTTSSAYVGNDEVRDTAEGWALTGPRGVYVLFDVYSDTHDSAFGVACLLQTALYAPEPQAILRAANMATWQTGDVVDLSSLLSTGFEGRARLSVRFGLSSSLALALDSIEEADVMGEVFETTADPSLVALAVTLKD